MTQKFTRPHCHGANGNVERLNRTLATERAYARAYASNEEGADALAAWLDYYNLDRPHLGIGSKPRSTEPTAVDVLRPKARR